MENNCKKCGAAIPATGKRGRPALTCPTCKATKKTTPPKAE